MKIIKNKINLIKLTRVLIFTTLSSFVVVVVVLFLLFVFTNSYLKSEKFKVATQEKLGGRLKAKGNFDKFNWSGSSVTTNRFSATGSNKSFFSKLRANGLRADFNIGAIKRRAWELATVDVNQLNVLIDRDIEGFNFEDQKTDNQIQRSNDSWFKRVFLPNRLLINSIRLADINFDYIDKPYDISGRGISLNATKGENDQIYKIQAFNGSIWAPEIPKFQLKKGTFRLLPNQLMIDGIDLLFYKNSRARIYGKVIRANDGFNLNIDSRVSDVPVEKILNNDWIKKLKGDVEVDINLTGSLDDYFLSGKAALLNGHLEAVPILESVDDILGTSKFRKLALNELTVDFKFDQLDNVEITQFYTHSFGAICATGRLFIRYKKIIRGVYMIGITPETLKWLSLPKKEILENVFSSERDVAMREVFNDVLNENESIRTPPPGFRWSICRIDPDSLDPFTSDIRKQFVKYGGLALWAELVGVGNAGLKAIDLLAESALNKNLDLNSLIEFEEGMFNDDSLRALADKLGVSEQMDKIIEGISINSSKIPGGLFEQSKSLLDELFFSN